MPSNLISQFCLIEARGMSRFDCFCIAVAATHWLVANTPPPLYEGVLQAVLPTCSSPSESMSRSTIFCQTYHPSQGGGAGFRGWDYANSLIKLLVTMSGQDDCSLVSPPPSPHLSSCHSPQPDSDVRKKQEDLSYLVFEKAKWQSFDTKGPDTVDTVRFTQVLPTPDVRRQLARMRKVLQFLDSTLPRVLSKY